MNRFIFQDRATDTDWECFGHFDPFNIICKKRCALRLGCVVAREKIARFESLAELTLDESLPIKIQ